MESTAYNHTPQSVFIHTFGCQMNVSDSEAMVSALTAHGYSIASEMAEADVIVFNTCAIRDKAEQKLRSYLGRAVLAKRAKPIIKIVLAGCMSPRVGDKFRKGVPEIDIVMGPDQAADLPLLLALQAQKKGALIAADFDAPSEPFCPSPQTYSQKTSGYVPIMKGCEHHCTYCVVPSARGPEKSRPLASILDEIHFLIRAQGMKEVTLIGQNVNGYGRDTVFDFPKLLWRLAQIPGLCRIRFMTSHPKDCGPQLADCFAKIPQVMPHIHLPVQSGSNHVLQRMGRGYTREHYLGIVDMLKKAQPRLALSTDFIVGFPGETDADFEQTMDLARRLEFDFAYSFLYSERPNTPASRLKDDVPLEVKKARLAALQALIIDSTRAKSDKYIGTDQEILVTNVVRENGELWAEGKTDTFKFVRARVEADVAPQDIITVRVTTRDDSRLEGDRLPDSPSDFIPSSYKASRQPQLGGVV